MRDDLSRLLPLRSPERLPNRAPRQGRLPCVRPGPRPRVARANGVCAERLRHFPDSRSFAPVRVKAVVARRMDVGDGASALEASAVAEAALPRAFRGGCRRPLPAAATAARSSTGRGGDAAGCGGRLRPDGGIGASRRSHAPGRLRLPLRRRTGSALRRPPRPDAGWRRRATRCIAARPSSTSGPNRIRLACGNASRFGFVQRYSWEAWHFGFDAGPRRVRRQAIRGGPARRRRRLTLRRHRLSRLRSRPFPGAVAPGRGPLERLGRPARRAAHGRVELQPLRRFAGGRSRHRPVHPL